MAISISEESIFLFGGEYFGGVNNEFEIYNIDENKGSRLLKTDITPRHGAGAIIVDNRLYVIGGGTTYFFGPTGLNERVDLRELALSNPILIK